MASGQLPHSTYSKAAGSPGPQEPGYAGEGPRIREGKEQMLGRFPPFLRFELQGQMGQIQLPAGRPQCPRAVGAGRGLGAGVPGPAASSTGMTPALLRAVVAALESLSGSGSYLLLVSEGRARVVLSREGGHCCFLGWALRRGGDKVARGHPLV